MGDRLFHGTALPVIPTTVLKGIAGASTVTKIWVFGAE